MTKFYTKDKKIHPITSRKMNMGTYQHSVAHLSVPKRLSRQKVTTRIFYNDRDRMVQDIRVLSEKYPKLEFADTRADQLNWIDIYPSSKSNQAVKFIEDNDSKRTFPNITAKTVIERRQQIKSKHELINPNLTTTISDRIAQGLPLKPFDNEDWKRVEGIKQKLKDSNLDWDKAGIEPIKVQKLSSGEIDVIDGDHRVLAARQLGIKVPIEFKKNTQPQKKLSRTSLQPLLDNFTQKSVNGNKYHQTRYRGTKGDYRILVDVTTYHENRGPKDYDLRIEKNGSTVKEKSYSSGEQLQSDLEEYLK
jgi:hypothetical protein